MATPEQIRSAWQTMSPQEQQGFIQSLSDSEAAKLADSLSAKADPSLLDRAAQGAGGITEGVVRTAGALTGDLANNVANLGRAAFGTAATALGRPDLAPAPVPASQAPLTGDWLVNKLEGTGIFGPRTGDTAERYIRTPAEFAGASMLGGPQGLAARMAGGAVSGLTSQAAADAFPNSPVAPMIGSFIPAAIGLGAQAALRGSLRGGPANAQTMQNNIAAQEQAGMPTDAALAAGGRTAGLVKYLGKAPFGILPVARKGAQIQNSLKGYLNSLTQSASDPTQVGKDIQSGIGDFVGASKGNWQKINGQLAKAVPKGTDVNLVDTKNILDDLTGKISDPAFSGAIKSPDILQKLKDAVSSKSTVSFDTADQLRRFVGQKANDSALISDVSKGQWKALYGALKSDMKASLPQGSRAAHLFDRSNTYWSAVHDRVDNIYGPISGLGTPEAKYFKSVSALNRGATQLDAIRKVMPKENFSTLRDTFISDMGKSTPGRQNALGDAFSSERFLTNWNSLSANAKWALVGDNSQLRSNLDLLAKHSNDIRMLENLYQNPSGTGMAAGTIMTGGLAVGSALQRNFGMLASVLGGMGVNNLSAKLMTSPKFAKFLADTTKVPTDKMPAMISRFQYQVQNDPELKKALAGQ